MLTLVLLAACTGPVADDTSHESDAFEYALDDVLRFNHITAVGTHNSYHVQTVDLPEWGYTHDPLDVQLGQHGVRQFELDLYWNEANGAFDVLHAPLVDEGTTCPTLVACLTTMKQWSDANPAHHPLMTLIEPKSDRDDDDPVHADRIAALEAELLSVWPEERLVTPVPVRRDQASVSAGIEVHGWPTLGELRGKAMFVLHDSGHWKDAHLASGADLMFQDAFGDATVEHAAVHSMNDPTDERIAEIVGFGHMVRTRADSDPSAVKDGDTARREAALQSGAHWLSTDFPAPTDDTDYVMQIPGGTPSGCNPMTAPEACLSEAVEDPTFIE